MEAQEALVELADVPPSARQKKTQAMKIYGL
jgi:hypothetical protein